MDLIIELMGNQISGVDRKSAIWNFGWMDMKAFEAERWEREGWELHRTAYSDRLKGQHAGLTKKRIETFEWVSKAADEVKLAYEALGIEAGETVGGTKLAAQLEAQNMLTQRGVKPTKLSDKGKAWANALVNEIDASMVDEAVLECRTLMTAKCLSADFNNETLGNLEREYVEIIADIIALGRRLRNQQAMSRGWLIDRAVEDAQEAARRQRSDKPPVTMAARERYWQDRPAPVRKIFDRSVS